MKTWISSCLAGATFLGATAGPAAAAEKKSLAIEDARKVLAAAVSEARKDAAHPTAAIAVVDDGGNVLCLERLDQTFPAGSNISIGKARTAALFKKPTKFFEDVINKGRVAMTALPDFTPLQGGEPILVDGQVVGAVGVSGAASAQRDEEIASAAAQVLAANTAALAVTQFDAQKVADSFARGAVLFDGNGANYQVHTSRRTGPGEVEIHTKETDVIYVLDGAATFVTGGTIVNPRTVAADQIRGGDVRGGEVRQLKKGDVIIVPAGVAHWFKQVSDPLVYYVVKVS